MMRPVLPSASFSVHGFIDKVGADAGFAAIIAVAIIVIMLFVAARETRLLRDRAEDAEDRVNALEQELAAVSRTATAAAQTARTAAGANAAAANVQARTAVPGRPGVTPPPASAGNAVPATRSGATTAWTPSPGLSGAATAPASAAGLAPTAPVGTGAPALSSATRLIPAPVARNGSAPSAAPAVAAAPAAAVVASAAATSATSAGGASAGATAAGGASVAAAPSTAAAQPTPAPSAAETQATRPSGGRPSTVPPPAGAASGAVRAPRRDYGRERKESRIGIRSIVAACVLIVIIAVAAVIVLTHHSSHAKRAASTGHTSTSGRSGKRGTRRSIDPRNVTVAVLNGTTTNNLAADISTQLNKRGFREGTKANFSNSTQTTSTVTYVPGHRLQALAVAKALKLKPADVKAVNSQTRELACNTSSSSCPDQVIVVAGADLDSHA